MTAKNGKKVAFVKEPRPQIIPNKSHVDQRRIGAQVKTAIANATSKATKLSFPRRAISGNQPGKTKGHNAGAVFIARPKPEVGKLFAAIKTARHSDNHAAR